MNGISVITCSINPEQCQKMLDSVKDTIGIAFESVVFDNRDKQWGICKVYNHCADLAKYPYLCFVHEDVIMGTSGWGKAMVEFAESDPNCGVIGFAGGRVASRYFCSWADGDIRCRYTDENEDSRITEKFAKGHINDLHIRLINPDNEIFSQVLTLDGVFLFTKKNVWGKYRFDEQTFSGFHFYDADFTFAAGQQYQNYVYLGADLYHLSCGKITKTYCNAMFAFQKKWEKQLPCFLTKLSWFQKTKIEYANAYQLYNLYKKNGFSFYERIVRIKKINKYFSFTLLSMYHGKHILFDKMRQHGLKQCIVILKDRLFRKPIPRIDGYNEIVKYIVNKKGLEIGGPSGIFSPLNYIPVYNKMKSLDGVNFSSATIWTGKVDSENGFFINNKCVGKLYIADATDLSIVTDNNYDFVLSSNNIEHIANPMKAIEQWISKLKTGGILIIVAPRKESCFDHKRSVVKFEHIMDDYQNNIDEHDLTHLDEILSLHDLSMDLPAGTFEQFKERSLNNFENRCLHQHVFDLDVLEQMYKQFNLKIILKNKRENDYTIVGHVSSLS